MKNILLITNIYPNNDSNYSGTSVCHYFTREWVKLGYNIKVIHLHSTLPILFNFLPSKFYNYYRAKTGSLIYRKPIRVVQKYFVENVEVLYIPLFKFFPRVKFRQKTINRALEIIEYELLISNFIPDIITIHFTYPQLQLLSLLKTKFPKAKTSAIFHDDGSLIPQIYPEYKIYFDSVNVCGFRSEAFRTNFELNFGKQKDSFICYSGIPEEYINDNIKKDFSKRINHFSFLGSLFQLKRVDDTIKSLKNVFDNENFRFDIIGDGAERANIEGLINELGLGDRVKLYGEVQRDKAQEILEESQCFIMISSREAFGLVYVEAMAKGCITIGTKGQGIDGVIKHGENGFLCNSSNVEELTNLIKEIINLPNYELQRISNNAIETAKDLTDRKVAEHYINSVINAK